MAKTSKIVKNIREHILPQNLYKGLKTVQDLIEHEAKILQSFNKEMEDL